MIGTVVLDEIPMRITDVKLEHGRFLLYATSLQPRSVSVRANADLTVFGSDGTVIVHQPSRSGGDITETKDGYLNAIVPIVLINA